MQNIIQAFDAASAAEPDFSVPFEAQRAIPAETKEKYLTSFTNKVHGDFVSTVLDNTRYISHKEFLGKLSQSFTLFENDIGNKPFHVYLHAEKFSSEALFTLYLWPRIRKLNFQGFVGEIVNGGDHILIIDDAIYCGNNAMSVVDEITYANKSRHSKENPISFHYVIPFVSSQGKRNVTEFTSPGQFPAVIVYNIEVIPTLVEMYPLYTDEISNDFGLSYNIQTPLYFDHKVACVFSTFSTIYLNGAVPGSDSFGMLLPHKPASILKWRIWTCYFSSVMKPPTA